MLSTKIKAATEQAHQSLEGKVVRRLKSIRGNKDYADLLKYFYAYFKGLEAAVAPYITPEVLADYGERRHADHLKTDIINLGADDQDLPVVQIPEISNPVEAMGALYVMEGSVMGGPYIVQMLSKGGVTEGVSFFAGYGAETGRMWAGFVDALNKIAPTGNEERQAIEKANETFSNFALMFDVTEAV